MTTRLRNEKILSDIRALSSGTLASLAGVDDYNSIERIQTAMLQLAISVMSSSPAEFGSWQDVWNRLLYVEASNLTHRAMYGPAGLRHPALDLSVVPGPVRAQAADVLALTGYRHWPAELECLRRGRVPARVEAGSAALACPV